MLCLELPLQACPHSHSPGCLPEQKSRQKRRGHRMDIFKLNCTDLFNFEMFALKSMFPRDPTRRKQWAAALKREGFVATEYSRICSDHFTKESYDGSGRLNCSAVPTVFNFPDHLRLTESKPRKAPASRVCVAEAATTATPPSSADQPVSPQPDLGPSTHQVTKDHGYCLSSPRKMKRKIDALAGYAESYKKKIKNVQQQSRRLAIKVANLSEIVQDLKNKNYVLDSCAELLEQSFSGVPLQLMKRILQKKGQGSFHPSLKAFAIILQFYSTKAYNFVRDTFGLGLPAVSTLRG
ncbi:THAP domain containing 6 [Plakobranchus ocellatus]|uniref:THAP domain containing 6 n=1 Tax=Plakobranchus ocellatus TaxID=259542 RepID=A0AAV4DSJ1_9GAST|nr:THAP domain containing 6 [Plakobranchus ocellatus]